MQLDVERKLTEARTGLVLGQPFFGMLALRLEVRENPKIKTARTNGIAVEFNPDWVRDLCAPELQAVFAHCVMHAAMGHAVRRGSRDPKRWNLACDHAIDPELVAAGFRLPGGGSVDPRFPGKSAESIYAILEAEEQDQQQGGKSGRQDQKGQSPSQGAGQSPSSPQGGQDDDPGGCGAVIDMPAADGGTATEADMEAGAREWEVAVAQAAQASKAAGKLPGDLERLARALVAPKADWRDLLRRFFTDKSRTESTWSRPNRRMLASGIYFPASKPVGMGEVVVLVDTSGSINERQFSAFAAEINAIAADTVPSKVTVIYADIKIRGIEEFTPDDFPLTLKAQGGGGTDLRSAFTWVAEMNPAPVALVCLTDLIYGDRWPADPGIPTLWAVTGRQTRAPFGDVVSVD